jgi:alanine racemase
MACARTRDGGPRVTDRLGGRRLGHRDAWVEIDLRALRANAELLRSLRPTTQLAPVVKANGYGHGALEVTRALLQDGYRVFCVATVEEGLHLRSLGSDLRVIVLYQPPLWAVEEAIRADLELAITAREGLDHVLHMAARDGRLPAIHLKFDTGMTRQGLLAEEVERLIEAPHRLRPAVAGLWTHLADGADELMTRVQVEQFEAVCQALAGAGILAPRHIAASAAILAGTTPAYEMARPGLSLYGLVPDEYVANGRPLPVELRPVMAVYARPVRLAAVPSGTAVGYGGTYRTDRSSRIATLPLGYADGIPRALSGRDFPVVVRGQLAPVVGRVSMDGITVDVTDVTGVTVADVFTILGEQEGAVVTANEMALAAQTIPQEIGLGFGRRLPFRYLS